MKNSKPNPPAKKSTDAPAPAENPANPVRVAIVEDHTLMREGLAQLVNSQPGMSVVVEAADASEGLSGILDTQPDLALIDITLPGRNGLELIKDLIAQRPQLPILVVSMHDETLYAERALKAGAKGYMMKDADRTTIITAIRRILAGGFYVSDRMAGEIFASFAGKAAAKNEAGGAVAKLSDREFEVFEHLGAGLGTNEIAERLGISPKTVEVHRARIREKLGLPNGAALVRYAVRWVETRNLGASPAEIQTEKAPAAPAAHSEPHA
jgi:DNA-binding NarL/FixJ family response regulator